ncbi:hypothetical protein DY000_02058614 [Brassica cretica]|uniref:Retrotransposon gag domain-containing protein n=1 Tax=Brassica cretica TaxID=69181 RepID=A0ABQ7AQG5_BRACR|nr:hypothetical protein DY000_02058614 [Brassica cretica]
MTVDEHNEPSDDAARVAELQKQVDGMQSQITEMNRTQEATGENPNLFSEVQSLKQKLAERSKQLEQGGEKLSQLQSENMVLRDQNQARSRACNEKRRFKTQVRPMGNLNTPNSREGATDPTHGSGVAGATREGAENPQVYNLEESDSEPESDKETPEKISATESSMNAYLEKMFSKRFDAMQSMVERLPEVAPPIRRSNPDSYADTPFVEGIVSVEIPRKFSFPSIKMYDGTGDPADHIAQYKQQMLAVALPKESREATMCKGFGSTLIGPALQWYINLPTRSISSFTSLSDKFVEQFASSRSLEKTSDDLYEILHHRGPASRLGPLQRTNHVSLEDHGKRVIPGLAQAKWEEDVASRANAQPKQDQNSARWDQGNQNERSSQRATKDSGNRNQGRFQYQPLEKEEGMLVSTGPDISHLLISTPELVNVLRHIGQQVKWPQKMKAPDPLRNPGLWCDFHRDHGHKTEDYVALRIEVNELLQKGHLREFLSEKSKNHLNKEVPVKSAGAIPASPPRQDRVINVISGGSEISGVSHVAAKKSTCNAKHGLETTKPKPLLLAPATSSSRLLTVGVENGFSKSTAKIIILANSSRKTSRKKYRKNTNTYGRGSPERSVRKETGQDPRAGPFSQNHLAHGRGRPAPRSPRPWARTTGTTVTSPMGEDDHHQGHLAHGRGRPSPRLPRPRARMTSTTVTSPMGEDDHHQGHLAHG